MSEQRRAAHTSWADDDDDDAGANFDDIPTGKAQDDASTLAKGLSDLSTGESPTNPDQKSQPEPSSNFQPSADQPHLSPTSPQAARQPAQGEPASQEITEEDTMSNGGWGNDGGDDSNKNDEPAVDSWGQPASGGGGGGGDSGWGAPLGSDSGGGYGGGDGGYGGGGGGGRGRDNSDYQAALGEEVDESGLILNEYKVEVKLADLQEDPNSPLYSIKTFEELNLHPDLQKGIYGVGFKKPSKIQERALPLLLNNPPRNLIGQSQSGTGKTAAFALNMLSRVSQDILSPQAICLAPSRELAVQIQKVIDDLCKFTNVKTALCVPRSWDRRRPVEAQILVGTPGTIVDMLSRGVDIFDPEMIRMLVLDEADEMVAIQGQGDQTTRIKRMLPPGTQNVLFSATFTDEVREFAQEFAPEANQIFLAKEEVTVDSITQMYMLCDGEDAKFDALSALYDVMTIGQSIVFCKKRDTSDEIAERLTELGHSVASLHGLKDSGDRDRILDGFRNGKTKVLITTNVVARGIDIQQVNMVVNYDVPNLGPEGDWRPDVETYIHRIGRTGRFGRKGCAVTLVHDGRSKGEIDFIMEATSRPMKRIDAGRATDIDVLEKVLKAALKSAGSA